MRLLPSPKTTASTLWCECVVTVSRLQQELGLGGQAKQRTWVVTWLPQRRSYVAQTRLARSHHSLAVRIEKFRGGVEPATELLGSWKNVDLCALNKVWGMNPRDSRSGCDSHHSRYALNEVWGMNPRDSAKRPNQALEEQNSTDWGHIASLSAPTKSDYVAGDTTSLEVRKPLTGSRVRRVFVPVCRNQDAV